MSADFSAVCGVVTLLLLLLLVVVVASCMLPEKKDKCSWLTTMV